jgi:imidazolonepropionase-like amidohydrolase
MNDNEKRFREITIRNLRRLKDAGVTIAIGSDTTAGAGVLNEVRFLHETGLFSNLELLKMWSETTPTFIYPKRKIGALKEGYEANFVVLEGDPSRDFSRTQKILMRVKQGQPF